jgi:protein-disulfide isomerase
VLDAQNRSELAAPVSDQRDHILGPARPPVTLVEYGDYECPHCGQAHYVLQDLMSALREQVRLVFRNFPLSQIHPHAGQAAQAAEAAGAQGRFWEMHDVIFENQDALEEEDLLAYAEQVGLDLNRFQLELFQGAYAPRVREDFLSGVRSGVNGTPTFFINGRRHDGAWDLQPLTDAILSSAHTGAGAHHGHRGHGPQA